VILTHRDRSAEDARKVFQVRNDVPDAFAVVPARLDLMVTMEGSWDPAMAPRMTG